MTQTKQPPEISARFTALQRHVLHGVGGGVEKASICFPVLVACAGFPVVRRINTKFSHECFLSPPALDAASFGGRPSPLLDHRQVIKGTIEGLVSRLPLSVTLLYRRADTSA